MRDSYLEIVDRNFTLIVNQNRKQIQTPYNLTDRQIWKLTDQMKSHNMLWNFTTFSSTQILIK